MRTMQFGVVEGKRLLLMSTGGNELPLPECAPPKSAMGLHKQFRILGIPGNMEELLTYFPCGLVLRSQLIDQPQSLLHREKLGSFPNLPTQCERARISRFHLRGGVTPRRHQGRPERNLH
ncbi:hypothetical protein D3C72_1666680 [compost metagenome]